MTLGDRMTFYLTPTDDWKKFDYINGPIKIAIRRKRAPLTPWLIPIAAPIPADFRETLALGADCATRNGTLVGKGS